MVLTLRLVAVKFSIFNAFLGVLATGLSDEILILCTNVSEGCDGPECNGSARPPVVLSITWSPCSAMDSGNGPYLVDRRKLRRNTWNVLGSVLCYVQTDRNGLFIVPMVDSRDVLMRNSVVSRVVRAAEALRHLLSSIRSHSWCACLLTEGKCLTSRHVVTAKLENLVTPCLCPVRVQVLISRSRTLCPCAALSSVL